MMETKEIIDAIETMEKKMQQMEKENSALRLELWKKDQQIDKLSTELDEWRNRVRIDNQ